MTIASSKSQLQKWNEQALIPGPEETEEKFKERALFCFNLKTYLSQNVAELPFHMTDQASTSILQTADTKLASLYGISPNWVPLFLNNYQLAPWHGGCAWIFQLDEKTPTSAFLQLRAQFRHQTAYLGLYHRDELIAHELAHVGRMMYQEPKFEEILAYKTSESKWRRWLGPIVQSSKESLAFILLLGLIIMAHLALLSLNQPITYVWTFGLEMVLTGVILLGIGRLTWRHWQFDRCVQKLAAIYSDPQVAQHVTYRLTDWEIIYFSSASEENIRTFIESQNSFRWQFLQAVYPIPSNFLKNINITG